MSGLSGVSDVYKGQVCVWVCVCVCLWLVPEALRHSFVALLTQGRSGEALDYRAVVLMPLPHVGAHQGAGHGQVVSKSRNLPPGGAEQRS